MNLATTSDELNCAIERLRNSGVESPQLDSQLMMAHALECSRLDLISHPERELTAAQLESFRSMLDRRARRYPLAYIIGKKEFYGLLFDVTPEVLIPRPETEILVEECLKRVGDAPKIADVGTGSGAIAVTIAVNLPNARVWATDASESALNVALANAQKHAVMDRVSVIRGDLLEPLADFKLDMIVSNPPYIPSGDIDSLQIEVQFEPREALDGGVDGLDAYRRLLTQAVGITRTVALEIGAGQAESVVRIAKDAGWGCVEVVNDLSGIERVVICFDQKSEACQ